jgi:hypothetical protein
MGLAGGREVRGECAGLVWQVGFGALLLHLGIRPGFLIILKISSAAAENSRNP